MRVPSWRRASRWVSSLRRPILSPPGRGSTARPVRARRGAARRNEARISAASGASGRDSRSLPASTPTACSPDQSTGTPRARRSSISVVTSRMRGTFSITTVPAARSDAARSGSASFLFPLGVTSPPTGCPPSITKRSLAVESAEGIRLDVRRPLDHRVLDEELLVDLDPDAGLFEWSHTAVAAELHLVDAPPHADDIGRVHAEHELAERRVHEVGDRARRAAVVRL